MRIAKLRSSIDAFLKSGGSHAKLDHLTLMEINTVRPFLPHALDQLFRLRQVSPLKIPLLALLKFCLFYRKRILDLTKLNNLFCLAERV